jgi:hypothetical protein
MTGKKGKRSKLGEDGKTVPRQKYEPGAGKGMYKENLSYEALADLIRGIITEKK